MTKLKLKNKTQGRPLDKLNSLEATTQKICPAQDYINDTLIYGYLEPSSKHWMFMTGTYVVFYNVLLIGIGLIVGLFVLISSQ